MQLTMQLGLQALAALVKDEKGIETYLGCRFHGELFRASERAAYDFIDGYIREHGAVPSAEVVEHHTGNTLPEVTEPVSYYVKGVRLRYLHVKLKATVEQVGNLLNAKDPEGALAMAIEELSSLSVESHAGDLVDLKSEALDYIQHDYNLVKSLGDEYGVQLGWPYLDNMVGGLRGGDILSLIGRPAQGKSYLILQMAIHCWRMGKVPMIVSMEMKPLPIIQRAVAILTSTPVDKIKKAELPTVPHNEEKAFFDAVSELGTMPNPFWILDGNLAASSTQITMLAQQLKPDIIFIDGAYMVQPPNRSNSTWEKVKYALEDLKQNTCTKLDIPLIASYQFNKESTKVKTQEEVGLEHIAGGEVIGQISSVVLGLLEEEAVETLLSKEIRILKGRSGEVGRFRVNWKFSEFPYMDFSQVEDLDTDESLDFF